MTTNTEDPAAYVAANLDAIQAAASAGSKEAWHLLDVRLGYINAQKAAQHWGYELSAAVYQFEHRNEQEQS